MYCQAYVDLVKKEIKETAASITKLNVSIKTAERFVDNYFLIM